MTDRLLYSLDKQEVSRISLDKNEPQTSGLDIVQVVKKRATVNRPGSSQTNEMTSSEIRRMIQTGFRSQPFIKKNIRRQE
jgi:hypothetical protein